MSKHTVNIPRYLISFTCEMVVPKVNDTDKHKALFHVPMHKQHNFHVLTTVSSLSSSRSHVLTRASRTQTVGAISKTSSAYKIIQTLGTDRRVVVRSSK